jgi:hypothetical protein
MTHTTFEPEPALISLRLPSRRPPILARLTRSACVGISLSVPYLVYLLQSHAH